MGRLVSRPVVQSSNRSIIQSPCSIHWRSSPRPDLAVLSAAARSGGQGWPKAIAKRLALDGREHSGMLVVRVEGILRWWLLYGDFSVDSYDDTEGSSPSGASIAPQTCIRSIHGDRHHDAVMRIGGELRGGGPILNRGSKTMCSVGLPPPRSVICRSSIDTTAESSRVDEWLRRRP